MNQHFDNQPGRLRGSDSADAATSRRVLVVDDDLDAAEALSELLSMNGHEVRLATSADEALMHFRTMQPQVAVLDIGLPLMDGYELQSRMRTLPGGGDCRYLALTGYGTQSAHEDSRQAGFHAHLVKPVDLKQLLELIEGSTGEGR
jgi:CheY-like chemotaxis protein